MGEKMDRGLVTDACKAHLENTDFLDVRQTRKGWCQECLGCEAKTEFKYFNKEKTQIAHSVEESGCCCRICFSAIHPFKMAVLETSTDAELLTVNRPCACVAGSCKCCCYQHAYFTSGGKDLGKIQETCYFCVPSFKLYDANDEQVYLIHPPTCCGGICINCCAEGNPCCGRGCCRASMRIFPASQTETNGDAPYVGQILKKPKSLRTEIFTEADAFEVHFPSDATTDVKAMLVGSAIFLNALFFEGDQNQGQS